MSIQFEDNRVQVKAAIDSAISAFLHELSEIPGLIPDRPKEVMNIKSMSLPGNVRLEVTLKMRSGKNLERVNML